MRSLSDLQLPTLRAAMDVGRIVTVLLDTPGKSVNSLTPAMMSDLATVLCEIEEQKPAGVIFASAKKRSFIAGADLFQIREMNRDQIEQFLRDGQAVFERIARLPMPTAAAINGDCLGGGLELALACTTRVAVNDGAISIGLPEVKLGILPGWGGTVRLPGRIGLPNALPLLLTGKALPPRKAHKVGLVDETVRPEVLLDAARRRIIQGTGPRAVPVLHRVGAKVPALRRRIFAAAETKTRATTRGNYPAPVRIIDTVRIGIENGTQAGMNAERAALTELMETDASRNLVRLFFLKHGAKRAIFSALNAQPDEVTYAAVIGGGTMGSGIAHALVRAGIPVRLIEVDPKAASGGLTRIRKTLDDDVAAGRITALDARHAMNRVAPSCDWTGLKLARFVIEAVAEQIDVKRSVFEKLDRLTRPDAVLASNTSSLSIAQIAAATANPSRVIGLHFFNPVSKMPLVEVVRAPRSDDRALATAAALSLRLGKTPLLVKDAPGFLVNRVLIPYMAEAIRAAAEGIPVPAIDRALKDWGMPMGPFELLDEIGLDVGVHVLESFGNVFGDYAHAPAGMARAIERGWLGKKSGRGFYVYDVARKRKGETPVNTEMTALLTSGTPALPVPADAEIQWRLVLPMINEAARLLDERVAASADEIDLGTVLGLGLAPFRGGLAHFADTIGSESLVDNMRRQASEHGPRFAAAPLLARLAAAQLPLSRFAELGAQRGAVDELASPVSAHAMTT